MQITDITIGAGKVRHGSLLDVKGTRYKLQIIKTETNTEVIELENQQTGKCTKVGQCVDGELEFGGTLFWAKIVSNEGQEAGNG